MKVRTRNKDFNRVLKLLARMKWRIHYAGKHLKLFSPNIENRMVVVSKTPSDSRAFQNFRHELMRTANVCL